jgi:hypothetical protein
VHAAGEKAVCNDTTCSVTKPILANTTYTTASIQWVLADNNTASDESRIGLSESFSCAGSALTPLRGDFTGDGIVDIFDYNKLVARFGQEDCSVNLMGPSCVIDKEDFTYFLTQFGLKRMAQ